MDSPLDFSSTVQYIELIRILKPALQWTQASYQLGPPDNLPVNVHDFLKIALNLTDELTKSAWSRLCDTAWSHDFTATEELAARTKYIILFLQHGLSRNIGIYALEPTTRACIDAGCAQQLHADPSVMRDRELSEPITNKITVYTKEFGSVPGPSAFARLCMSAMCDWLVLAKMLGITPVTSAAGSMNRMDSGILFVPQLQMVLQSAGRAAQSMTASNHFPQQNIATVTLIANLTSRKAMFQLKHRLERLKVSQTHDSISTGSHVMARDRMAGMTDEQDGELLPNLIDAPTDEEDETEVEGLGPTEDEDVEIDADGICDGKPETGNRTVRARFGRRRTHNEELCVASCGVILGRATFYGSEAPNGVREFWMKLFPTKRSLPQVLWHDNNCRVVAMLRNDADPRLANYFESCALPVDVFHFKCKHKETDVDCGRNCNPYLWSELRTDDGKWRFNSSAAEQTNTWFGGFQSMVREMQADRYDFFLDEMIRRRNVSIIKILEQKGKAPYSIPREELLSDSGSTV
ncbi:hypothetical protein C8R45DRAFT_1101158 [Mycena sanguinolenta]|nr:hypothetical protein C8R45DRAFT_1101158 [Mycena sanguinolenta]